jgi:outer membrane lipoprotein SlyB
MTALVVVAGVLAGAFAGCCLAMAGSLAVISRSQERMQRKVRYWQAETVRARARAGDDTAPVEPPLNESAPARHEPWVW